jgi:hypothetical protein
MTNHTYEQHVNCQRPHCPICDGGLSHCTACGGMEGSLPSECPKFRMNFALQDAIYAQDVDYLEGRWVRLRPPHLTAK